MLLTYDIGSISWARIPTFEACATLCGARAERHMSRPDVEL